MQSFAAHISSIPGREQTFLALAGFEQVHSVVTGGSLSRSEARGAGTV